MIENEDNVQTPANAATPAQADNAEPTVSPPDWFLSEKYNSIEDQAKGVHDAVQAMKEAQLRAKEAEEEVERVRGDIENLKENPPSIDLGNASQKLVEDLEAKFQKPFAQIKAEADLQSLIIEQKLQPIKSIVLSQQFESMLDKMEGKSELFKKYRPKIEAKLAGRQIEEKVNPQNVKSAWNEVIAENIDEIRSEAIEAGKKLLSATPPTPPLIAAPGNSVPPVKTKISLSEEEKKYYEQVGANPGEIEKFHNDNVVAQRGKETGWGNLIE